MAPIASGAPSGRGLQRDSEREIPMKARLWFAVLAFFLMMGCSATARLYPVQGPLMAHSPAPVFTGKFTGVLNGGSISFVLSNGELCQGRWTRNGSGEGFARHAIRSAPGITRHAGYLGPDLRTRILRFSRCWAAGCTARR